MYIYIWCDLLFDVAVDRIRWSGSKIVDLSQSERLLEASWNDVDLAQLIWHFLVTLTSPDIENLWNGSDE